MAERCGAWVRGARAGGPCRRALVRGEGRGVSDWYGVRDAACPLSTRGGGGAPAGHVVQRMLVVLGALRAPPRQLPLPPRPRPQNPRARARRGAAASRARAGKGRVWGRERRRGRGRGKGACGGERGVCVGGNGSKRRMRLCAWEAPPDLEVSDQLSARERRALEPRQPLLPQGLHLAGLGPQHGRAPRVQRRAPPRDALEHRLQVRLLHLPRPTRTKLSRGRSSAANEDQPRTERISPLRAEAEAGRRGRAGAGWGGWRAWRVVPGGSAATARSASCGASTSHTRARARARAAGAAGVQGRRGGQCREGAVRAGEVADREPLLRLIQPLGRSARASATPPAHVLRTRTTRRTKTRQAGAGEEPGGHGAGDRGRGRRAPRAAPRSGAPPKSARPVRQGGAAATTRGGRGS